MSSPAECTASAPLDQEVGHLTSVASIAVGKGMDEHHAVVKPNRDFINCEYLTLNPVVDVAKQRLKLR